MKKYRKCVIMLVRRNRLSRILLSLPGGVIMKKLSAIIIVLVILSSFIHASNCHGGHESHKKNGENAKTEKHKTTKRQTLCPITENSIDRRVYVDFEGNAHYTPKRIYVCCKDCKSKVEKKPARHVKRLLSWGQSVENRLHPEEEYSKVTNRKGVQEKSQTMLDHTKCPVMGNDINSSVSTKYMGKTVYFCCLTCIGKFNKDPESYIQ